MTRTGWIDAGDAHLYYREEGEGQPVVFISGWTLTTEFFQHLLPFFARSYRAITYDPRSQGRSSKTPGGHSFTRRALDLRAVLENLDLRDVVLVGWLHGAYDALAYLQQFGLDRVTAFVSVDEAPYRGNNGGTDWGEGLFDAIAGVMQAVRAAPQAFMTKYTAFMTDRQDERGAQRHFEQGSA